jgi:hypothetical protein
MGLPGVDLLDGPGRRFLDGCGPRDRSYLKLDASLKRTLRNYSVAAGQFHYDIRNLSATFQREQKGIRTIGAAFLSHLLREVYTASCFVTAASS